jgi:hypothetical protein
MSPDVIRTRAIENLVFTITANRVGEETVGGTLEEFLGGRRADLGRAPVPTTLLPRRHAPTVRNRLAAPSGNPDPRPFVYGVGHICGTHI